MWKPVSLLLMFVCVWEVGKVTLQQSLTARHMALHVCYIIALTYLMEAAASAFIGGGRWGVGGRHA